MDQETPLIPYQLVHRRLCQDQPLVVTYIPTGLFFHTQSFENILVFLTGWRRVCQPPHKCNVFLQGDYFFLGMKKQPLPSSPQNPVKLRKWKHQQHRLSNSASTSSLNHQSLPRPKSYVPFQGCVEIEPPQPGRAARDILHALSYAPTQDSFSQPPPSPPPTPPKMIPLTRTKSSSFASLICTQVLPEKLDPVLYVQTESEPVYAPTNPLNHPENRAIYNAHPPVIYPPPDLVLRPTFKPLTRPRSDDISMGSPGLSSASSGGFETARSSSSSMSSIFESQHAAAANHQHLLESIRETSPMTSSSRF